MPWDHLLHLAASWSAVCIHGIRRGGGVPQIQHWPLALLLPDSGLHMGWELSLKRLFVWNHYLLHTVLGGEHQV